MKWYAGSDHAGLRLKDRLVGLLRDLGDEVVDLGTHTEESVDYPDFALQVAQGVSNAEVERGILVCGTGIGMAITANKVRGIRAATCHNPRTARMAAEHNDANILCVGARVVEANVAIEIVKEWLKHEYLGGRHQRRLDKIAEMERTQIGATD